MSLRISTPEHSSDSESHQTVQRGPVGQLALAAPSSPALSVTATNAPRSSTGSPIATPAAVQQVQNTVSTQSLPTFPHPRRHNILVPTFLDPPGGPIVPRPIGTSLSADEAIPATSTDLLALARRDQERQERHQLLEDFYSRKPPKPDMGSASEDELPPSSFHGRNILPAPPSCGSSSDDDHFTVALTEQPQGATSNPKICPSESDKENTPPGAQSPTSSEILFTNALNRGSCFHPAPLHPMTPPGTPPTTSPPTPSNPPSTNGRSSQWLGKK